MRASQKIRPFSAAYEPLSHMHPYIRISPFSSAHFELLQHKPVSPSSQRAGCPDFWLEEGNDMRFYESGRTAILAALRHEGLERRDEVVIITTTQGRYISGCVTQTIEKVCRWTRTIGPRTRMALVIHEFGFPCRAPEIAVCKKRGIPVLEDCAYALGSRVRGAEVGTFGDHAIYSFPKHFPVPFGGILISKSKLKRASDVPSLSVGDQNSLRKFVWRAVSQQRSWDEKRRENWNFFSRRLGAQGLKSFFTLPPRVVPGAFVFKLPMSWEGARRKIALTRAGVEATEYYHMGGFYVPVHQFLTDYDREYILQHFLKFSE